MTQKTIASSFHLEGHGVHTNAPVQVSLHPAEEHHGIQLLRSDLGETVPTRAHLSNLLHANHRNTTLSTERGSISTVEHLLAALTALEVDNCLIEVRGPELCILDGSANPWVQMILQTGIHTQKASRRKGTLSQPVIWQQGEVCLVAFPSSSYQIRYTLSYPHHPYLHAQFWEGNISPQTFQEQLASARTFCLWEDLEKLRHHGLILGGTLENGLVIRGMEAVNPEGFRYKDEPVRHKVLDLIGDLSLVGGPFDALILSLRSGHQTNVAFARELATQLVWSEEPQRSRNTTCV